jgi:PadR family transcriptional regulator, regulatory protein PadR
LAIPTGATRHFLGGRFLARPVAPWRDRGNQPKYLSNSMDPPATLPLAYRENQAYPISVTEEAPVSKPSDLLQGTLDFLILKILALEPLNGWAISQRLTQVSGDVLQVSDGSLYPALHKLEQEGWISSEWRPSENNRRAKFYTLTRLGRKQLNQESANWNRLSAAISHVMRLKET